jgi:tRNA(Ile)-lysidine synthase
MRGARPDQALSGHFMRGLGDTAPGKCAVALSGGSDSVALAGLSAERLSAADLVFFHVNHALRASSLQDESVAIAVAAHLHVPLRIVRLSGTVSDEANLRSLRYEALTKLARECGISTVLTGHTAQDQTETVLLALFRGSGRDGLCGMPHERALAADVRLVRPLLRADRIELQRYCERARLPYVVDPSNVDHAYRRNALRAHLSDLREHFPGMDRAIARCAAILRDEREGEQAALARSSARRALLDAGLGADLTFERIEATARLIQFSKGRSIRIRERKAEP